MLRDYKTGSVRLNTGPLRGFRLQMHRNPDCPKCRHPNVVVVYHDKTREYRARCPECKFTCWSKVVMGLRRGRPENN